VDSLLHFWWLIFPLGGAIGGGVRAISAANERRAERRLERYRIKQQTKIAMAQASQASGRTRDDDSLRRREVQKIIGEHDATDARWLDYELDVAKLLDFPVMTDLRDPLTIAFHKGKRRADLLRPDRIDDLLGDRGAQLEYRDAVHDYVTAFDIAEAEAVRRRRSDFSSADQGRLARAQNLLRLASDSGATPQERQNAYARARTELAGLIALPAATVAGIERTIAGELESSRPSAEAPERRCGEERDS
jgi:phage terminase small subunit